MGRTAVSETAVAPLSGGERLSRAEFLRRWEAMPELKRAERLEGVVHVMASPVSLWAHGNPHLKLGWLLGNYEMATPGTQSGADSTVLFDGDNDLQPDLCLIVLPERGGQTRRRGNYLAGAPELVAEIGHATARRDRTAKKNVYRRNGVREYLLWRPATREFEVFRNDDGEFVAVELVDGVWKSAAFPGLWVQVAALLAGDHATVKSVADAGLAAPEHAKFAADLAARSPR